MEIKVVLFNSYHFQQKATMGFLLFLVLMLVLPAHASDTALKFSKSKIETTTDLRVLVDISGSMKKQIRRIYVVQRYGY